MNRDSAEKDPSDRITDSPWFWVALFGFVAVVALVGIQGKFAQRQARLEQRYQDRLLAQRARTEQAQARPNSDVPIERGYEEEADQPIAVSMVEARAKMSLVPLAVVAATVTLVGLVGLALGRRNRLVLPPGGAGDEVPPGGDDAPTRPSRRHQAND